MIVKLSFTVVSEVECPIEIGPPDVTVLIVTPFDVFVLSIAQVVVALTSKAVPSTVNVPSISVLSKLVVPLMSTLPSISIEPLRETFPPEPPPPRLTYPLEPESTIVCPWI